MIQGTSPSSSSSSSRSSRRVAAQFSSSATPNLQHASSSPASIGDTSAISQHSKLWRNPSSVEEHVSRTQQDRVNAANSGSTQLSGETGFRSSSRKSHSRSIKSPSQKNRLVLQHSYVHFFFVLLFRSIPLTGDAKADADIIAFYKARQKLIT